jgi:enamine deaminase RidA (YjgF/YER057c/UK114 family)
MSQQIDTIGRVWHPAPSQSAPINTGSIQGVWLRQNENVEWAWTHLPDGKSYISGFTILNPSDEIQPVELPKQIKESLEKLSAFKKAIVDSMILPDHLLKDDDRKKK